MRCSKYVMLKAGDVDAAVKVLGERGIETYEITESKEIKIFGEIGDTSKLIAALVGAGVAVYELASIQGTLEQYYLNRTGGNV